MTRYGLRDDQFARIQNLLPGRPGSVGPNSAGGNRLFVDAVTWEFRAGAPWRDLPERLRGLEKHACALFTLGQKRRLGESFQGLGQ